MPTVPVPDTGQTKCFNVEGFEIACPLPGQPLYGQDANYSINPVSYTKLDDSGKALPDSATSWVMVRDNVTGLIWENKTVDGTIHNKDKKYTWYDPKDPNPGTPGSTTTKNFVDTLNSDRFGGYNDWRLPTIKELNSIVNYAATSTGSAITVSYFPNTQSTFYWSSVTYAPGTDYAWGVDFGYGGEYAYGKVDSGYVRAVRGGQSGSLVGHLAIGSLDAVDGGSMGDASADAGSYKDNGDGTVTDTSTDLMWQQSGPNAMTWDKALAYCEELKLGGFMDWRLPSIKELCSLADYNLYNPAINAVFLNRIQSYYWSSTTLEAYSNYMDYAWGVDFYDGFCGYGGKFGYGHVRAVRGGQTGLLAATFAASPGLWVYNPDSAAWTQIASVTPFDMIYSGSMLYGDFGAEYGISMWNGYKWLKLTPTNSAGNMVVSGSMLYVDFGTLGIYKWDGSEWRNLTLTNPAGGNMVASGSMLYVDFGASYGLCSWDGTKWAQLTSANPENMVTSGVTLYVGFGASYGLYKWDGTSWSQLSTANPENMVASGSMLYGDFGASGVWRWDGAAWDQLSTANPENMVASGSMLYVDFGASGIWGWDGAKWARLKSDNPEKMVGSN